MKAMYRLSVALLCVISLGCGREHAAPGDDGGAPDAVEAGETGPTHQCPGASRCGGEISGTWNITSPAARP
jgi:hypothetical protein